MPANDSYIDINAKSQLQGHHSILSFWRKMIEFRKQYNNFLVYGDFHLCDPTTLQH
jgi:alpha-glucosidase